METVWEFWKKHELSEVKLIYHLIAIWPQANDASLGLSLPLYQMATGPS